MVLFTITLVNEVFLMLGFWRTHKEYQGYLLEKILPFFESDKDYVLQYEKSLAIEQIESFLQFGVSTSITV